MKLPVLMTLLAITLMALIFYIEYKTGCTYDNGYKEWNCPK